MIQPLAAYLPVFIHLLLAVLLTAALLGAHALVGGRHPTPAKLEPYESGVWPIGSARVRIPIRYYLIAMLFIIFDLEVVFLYPWAVVLREQGSVALWAMLVFVGVLAVGFVYEWARGGMEWE